MDDDVFNKYSLEPSLNGVVLAQRRLSSFWMALSKCIWWVRADAASRILRFFATVLFEIEFDSLEMLGSFNEYKIFGFQLNLFRTWWNL